MFQTIPISITLSSIAEFETNRRKERQMQGISAAKKAGKYPGRKTVIDDKLISEVKHLKQQKMLSVTQIVKITERSRNTIYKVLKMLYNANLLGLGRYSFPLS